METSRSECDGQIYVEGQRKKKFSQHMEDCAAVQCLSNSFGAAFETGMKIISRIQVTGALNAYRSLVAMMAEQGRLTHAASAWPGAGRRCDVTVKDLCPHRLKDQLRS